MNVGLHFNYERASSGDYPILVSNTTTNQRVRSKITRRLGLAVIAWLVYMDHSLNEPYTVHITQTMLHCFICQPSF